MGTTYASYNIIEEYNAPINLETLQEEKIYCKKTLMR